MSKQRKYLGIIPARYASTRFPGKPLVLIDGESMIRKVYTASARILDEVFVATDDVRIHDEVVSFGGKVVMTSSEHQTGTDRCAEALRIIEAENPKTFDVVLNIQGDEPFLAPEHLQLLMDAFSNPKTAIATLAKQISSPTELFNPNVVKVIFDNTKHAIYFSRQAIPFYRGREQKEWLQEQTYFKHLGLYAYRREALNTITQLPQSNLERSESLEQNRWIENGYRIRIRTTTIESIAIDTPEDLKRLENLTGTGT